MPLHLPQLSRRQFLKRVALAGAALGMMPPAYAEIFDKPVDKNTVVFFSDAHITADPKRINLGINMADNLAACVRELAARPTKPATVIVNGDLAFHWGKPEDYATFGTLIAPVRAIAPIHLSMGNHDARENFWKAFPADATAESAGLHRQATVFSAAEANWFLLDSLNITNSTPGLLGPEQLAWLARELDARPDRPAIVVPHHHPQFGAVTGGGLKDTAALMDILAPRRQVKALVFGHTHNWHFAEHDSGIHLINLPPTAYVFKAGRPSGWVRATLADGGADFELRSLDSKHPEHAQVHHLKWRTA